MFLVVLFFVWRATAPCDLTPLLNRQKHLTVTETCKTGLHHRKAFTKHWVAERSGIKLLESNSALTA